MERYRDLQVLVAKKAGLKDVESEIIEHNISYPKDICIRGNDRIRRRLKQVDPHTVRAMLEKQFHGLLENLEKYGEEWLPTLLIAGTKVNRSCQGCF